ncbi:hypothetical protein QCI42_12790 [Bacillus fungorum]|uniref:hypothetical protein n=1 Tax=Bacillus fungorum TaxID=2039284 RepID=UPI003394D64C
MNKEIGGFFELELSQNEEYHPFAIRLNKARSALYYILKAKKINKVYLPYYMGSSIPEPVKALKIDYELYRIDNSFYPIFNKTVGKQECFLYINYFGLYNQNVKKVVTNINNVIIDNTQAFFESPLPNIDTIYSARKFFGVPDGGYLYTNTILKEALTIDYSYNRLKFLAKRIDCSASESYSLYQKHEELLTNETPKYMSTFTHRMLKSIDYEQVKKRRNENFLYLHNKLQIINELDFDTTNLNGPMIYPLLIRQDNIKQSLIQNNIYVATYWKEVLSYTEADWFEYQLATHLIALPIDQRYSLQEMQHIIAVLNKMNLKIN